jgi:hypothetical protein
MLRHYLKQNFLFAMLSIGALSIAPALAQPQSWTQAGMLRCNLNPSIGFVIFGHQSMECNFQPVSGPVQGYEGAMNTVGLDLGISGGGRFAWAVFGSAAGMPYGALAGEYVGASGDIGLGLALAPTCSWAAQIAASLCNPSPLKDHWRSTLSPACRS